MKNEYDLIRQDEYVTVDTVPLADLNGYLEEVVDNLDGLLFSYQEEYEDLFITINTEEGTVILSGLPIPEEED